MSEVPLQRMETGGGGDAVGDTGKEDDALRGYLAHKRTHPPRTLP